MLTPWIMEDGIPVITGARAHRLCHAGGLWGQRGAFPVYRCRIYVPILRAPSPRPTRQACIAHFNQYGVDMGSSCSMLAITWCALVMDGADPGDVTTIHATFGACFDFPVIGRAPGIADALMECGLYYDLTVEAVNFGSHRWPEMAQSLATSALQGPVLVVAVMLGATRGVFLDAHGCWVFDSHGHQSALGDGAIVEYIASNQDLGRMLSIEGTAADALGQEVQLLVLRP